jgi:hypothetical protein
MADAFKVLGQSNPSALTLTMVYKCLSGKNAYVSSFYVCNQSATMPATWRLAVAVDGAADNAKQYLYSDLSIDPQDTYIAELGGLTLDAADEIRVWSSNDNLSFNIFGVERDA